MNSTFREMEVDGVIKIENKNGLTVLVLTQKGFDSIY